MSIIKKNSIPEARQRAFRPYVTRYSEREFVSLYEIMMHILRYSLRPGVEIKSNAMFKLFATDSTRVDRRREGGGAQTDLREVFRGNGSEIAGKIGKA